MSSAIGRVLVLGSLIALAAGLAAASDDGRPSFATETLDGKVVTPVGVFDSWSDYVRSDYFREHALRCGIPAPDDGLFLNPGDCSASTTNPAAIYDPSTRKYLIQVVVHVLQNTSGAGFISESLVQSQIDILNEDFLAMAGTNGALGEDAQIEFVLAQEDPSGNPTNGITYTTNNSWYNDSGSYYNTLAWDTNRYLNIYTNTAGGALGYVPALPQNGIVGSNQDRVVILWSSFGRNAPIGPPYNQGRTATHEVGHWLGLYHTFDFGCGSASACYTSGDRICDTNPESNPVFGCPGGHSSCGSSDPFDNYMDYTDDLCMERFTPEQARRMRCTLESWRPDAYTVGLCGNGTLDVGEECDDGNNQPFDGCSQDCAIEVAPEEVSPPGSDEPLRFISSTTFVWESAETVGADTFNVYRGPMTDLGHATFGSCVLSGLVDSRASQLFNPPPGGGYFYLVTGVNPYGESTLGDESDGTERAPTDECP